MRWIPFIFFLVIIMLIAASSLGDMISLGDYNIQPSLMLIVMIFFAVNCETSEAMICSFVIGLAADISSASMSMGPHAVTFGIVGTAISFIQSSLIMKRIAYQAICIFATGFLTGTMIEALTYSKLSGQTANSLSVITMVALYSAAIGPFIWFFFSAILGILVNKPTRYARKIE